MYLQYMVFISLVKSSTSGGAIPKKISDSGNAGNSLDSKLLTIDVMKCKNKY